MPSWDLSTPRTSLIVRSVLPKSIKSASRLGPQLGRWHRWAGEGVVIGVEHFGLCGPGRFRYLGITAAHVVAAALQILGRNAGRIRSTARRHPRHLLTACLPFWHRECNGAPWCAGRCVGKNAPKPFGFVPNA
jgi:hypothetical protein